MFFISDIIKIPTLHQYDEYDTCGKKMYYTIYNHYLVIDNTYRDLLTVHLETGTVVHLFDFSDAEIAA